MKLSKKKEGVALIRAIKSKNIVECRRLIEEEGADVNYKNKYGCS